MSCSRRPPELTRWEILQVQKMARYHGRARARTGLVMMSVLWLPLGVALGGLAGWYLHAFADRAPKPTPEELADEEKRSTATGFFNQAHSYWQAARALDQAKFTATHRDDPVYALYFHAVELYLKAFLRAHDLHPRELQNKYGHDTKKLARKARKLGLSSPPEDAEIFWFISKTAIGHRYLVTGRTRRLDKPIVDALCKGLHGSVGKELRAKGHPVRL
jgi:HEPN domain-containing protein